MTRGKIRKALLGVAAVFAVIVGVGLQVAGAEDASAMASGQWMYNADNGILIEQVGGESWIAGCNPYVRIYKWDSTRGKFFSDGIKESKRATTDANCDGTTDSVSFILDNRFLTFTNVWFADGDGSSGGTHLDFTAPDGKLMFGDTSSIAFDMTVAQYDNSSGTLKYYCRPYDSSENSLNAPCASLYGVFYDRGSMVPKFAISYSFDSDYNAGIYSRNTTLADGFSLSNDNTLKLFKQVDGVFAANEQQFMGETAGSFTYSEVAKAIDEINDIGDTGVEDGPTTTTASFDFWESTAAGDYSLYAIAIGGASGYFCRYDGYANSGYYTMEPSGCGSRASQEIRDFMNERGASIRKTDKARETVVFNTGDMASLTSKLPAMIARESVVPEGGDPNGDSTGEKDWSSCAVGAFSWVLCPLLEAGSGVVDKAYDWIEGQLQVETNLVSNTSGTNDAWAIFRDMANVVFIILMLVAIISQLTGYGLSNYNIKRILPRLIVVAIMLNISYFICQVAVDLSNILGSQLNGILGSIDVDGVVVPIGEELSASDVAGGFGLAIIAVVTAVSAVWFNIGIIALAVIGGLLSILLLVVILMIRKVAVVLLVAIAPLAFVCLLLPNTEGLFKKWFNIFKALLIIYPICGLLMGAGALASKIVISASGGDDLMNVIGGAMAVIPFFAVITLTKGSLNALGSIGAKLSGTLAGATSKLGGAIKSSAAGQALQNRDSEYRVKRLTGQTALQKSKLGRGFTSLTNRVPGIGDARARRAAGAFGEQAARERQITAGLEGMHQVSGVGEAGYSVDSTGAVTAAAAGEYGGALKALEDGNSMKMQALIQRYDETGRSGDLMRVMYSNTSGMTGKSAQAMQQMLSNTRNIKTDTLASAYTKSLQDHIESQMTSTAAGDISKVRVGSFNSMLTGTGSNDMAAQMRKMDAAKLGDTSKTSLAFLSSLSNNGGADQAAVNNLFSQVNVAEAAKAFANMSGDKAGGLENPASTGADASNTKGFATVMRAVSAAQANGTDDVVDRFSANDLAKMSDNAATYLDHVDWRGNNMTVGGYANSALSRLRTNTDPNSVRSKMSSQQRANVRNADINRYL